MPRSLTTHIDSPRDVGLRLKVARERVRPLPAPAGVPGLHGCVRLPAPGRRARALPCKWSTSSPLRLDVSGQWLATGVDAVTAEPTELIEAEVALRLGEYEEAGAPLIARTSSTAIRARVRARRARPDRVPRRADRRGDRFAGSRRSRRAGEGRSPTRGPSTRSAAPMRSPARWSRRSRSSSARSTRRTRPVRRSRSCASPCCSRTR